MKPYRIQQGLLLVLVSACAVLLAYQLVERWSKAAKPAVKRQATLGVAWRVPLAAKPNLPCAWEGGWIVTDAAGGVAGLSQEGVRLWQAGFSNQVFECAASVVSGLVAVASLQGRVCALRAATGEVVWTRETEGRFQHAPLTGLRSGEPVLWLMSQEDGKLFCLRLADGVVVWQSEATNRCDGEPALCQGRIAYGNCDGSVYVFSAESGVLCGSVAAGPEDQMAGGVLATEQGRLVAGTRQGNLVVVNAQQLTREALVPVSSNEMFVKPAVAFDGLIAVGTQEGEVAFWREGTQVFKRVAVGASVDGLVYEKGRLYVVAGGGVSVLESVDKVASRVAVGDEVHGPVAGRGGALACVADGAVVCLKGGGE